jgi:uncharacterized membrane protein YcaP (DUF421 family)
VTSLPRAPRLKRRFGAVQRLLSRLVLFLALPVLAVAGVLGYEGLDRALRVLVVFVTLLVVFRVIGKRELGRLSPFELVMLMLIPEVLSDVVQGEGSVMHAFSGLSTLFLLVLVTSALAHRFERFEKLVEPEPTLLVADGHILENALNEERITPDELFSEMRKQGIGRMSDVRWAVLESSGNVTFISNELHPRAAEDDGPVA